MTRLREAGSGNNLEKGLGEPGCRGSKGGRVIRGEEGGDKGGEGLRGEGGR